MITLQVLIILLCIVGSAFFSGIETGIISIRHLRLRHRLRSGDRRAKILAYFIEEPNRLLGTTLVGTNIFTVIASVLSASLARQTIGAGGEVVSTVLVSIILLLFGEYIPKAWFRARPYQRSARFAKILRLAWTILSPIGMAVTCLAGIMIPGKSNGNKDLSALANRGELKLLAEEGEKHGVLTSEERAMIHRTVELAEKPAQKIMTPLENILYISSTATVEEFLNLARKRELLRIPVRDPETNNFVGTIQVLEVLSAGNKTDRKLKKFINKPLFIPGSTPSDEIIPILRLNHKSMGFVTDNDGNVIGLVTSDDILRQIV